jgi:hypothetical protein
LAASSGILVQRKPFLAALQAVVENLFPDR